jgi:hypothetical protein
MGKPGDRRPPRQLAPCCPTAASAGCPHVANAVVLDAPLVTHNRRIENSGIMWTIW